MSYLSSACDRMRWPTVGEQIAAPCWRCSCVPHGPASSICPGICFVLPAAGMTEGHTNLGDVHGQSHCNTCQIDFSVNFDHNIEVVFKPNPSMRKVQFEAAFCVGSPQLQPHVVMAQTLSALRSLPVNLQLEPGRYTLRASKVAGSISLLADADGSPKSDIRVTSFGWPPEQGHVSPLPTLNLINATDPDQTFQLSAPPGAIRPRPRRM